MDKNATKKQELRGEFNVLR